MEQFTVDLNQMLSFFAGLMTAIAFVLAATRGIK